MLMDVFIDNLKYFEEVMRLTQKQIAEKMFVSPASYCKIRKGDQLPSLDFLLKCESYFGVSIDTLLRVNLKNMEQSESELIDSRYVGCYIVYHAEANLFSKFFCDSDNQFTEIKTGILIIKKSSCGKMLKAVFYSNFAREIGERHFRELKKLGNSFMNMQTYLNNVRTGCTVYEGNVHFTTQYMQICFTENKFGHKALLSFHRMNEGIRFQAALGTVSMTSDGGPSLGYIGVSHVILHEADEEILKSLMIQNRKKMDFLLIHEMVKRTLESCDEIEDCTVKQYMVSTAIYKFIERMLLDESSRPLGITPVEDNLWCAKVLRDNHKVKSA